MAISYGPYANIDSFFRKSVSISVMFSSNNPYHFEQQGYYICKNNTRSYLLPTKPKVHKISSDAICGKNSNVFMIVFMHINDCAKMTDFSRISIESDRYPPYDSDRSEIRNLSQPV